MGLIRRTPSFMAIPGVIFVLMAMAPNQWVAANVNMFNSEQAQFIGRDASGEVFRLDTEEVFPVAYYDINADKLTDVITVSKDRSSIDVFLAYTEKPYLRRAFNSQSIITDPEKRIISVRPGDFTGDGMGDLMVTLGKDKENDTDRHDSVDVIFCLVRFETDANLECSKHGSGAVIKGLAQEPTVLDLNGDMVLDLLGERLVVEPNSKNEKKKKMIWFSGNMKESFEWKNEAFKIIGEHSQERDMTNPSSIAYADVDGDSIPELRILTEDSFGSVHFLETYHIVRDIERVVAFRLKTVEIIGSQNDQTNVLGQPLIVDFEHNGKLFHLLPYCTDFGCQHQNGIYVIEGEHAFPLPLGPMEHDGVRYGFIPPPKPTKNPNSNESTPKTTPSPYHPENFKMETFYSRTIILRVGDYNLDGYPDLLGVLQTVGKQMDQRMTRAVLFENVACTPTAYNPCNYSRTFSPNFQILERYTNVISASFYDIRDNGVLDMLLVAQQQKVPTPPQFQKFSIKAFENEMNFDSSFLKVMVLTGQQCSRCESGIPYGNVLPGATVKYTSLNSKGQEESGVVTQTYRTSHLPLDLPSEIFGIGHSPNFIEKLVVAIAPNADEVYMKPWLQIIPNSQVVVVPNPLERPERWTMKLFLTPSDVVLKTFGILVAICAVFAVFVGALEFKERREDRLVRQSEAHRLVMY